MLQTSSDRITQETAVTMGKHILRLERYVDSMSNLAFSSAISVTGITLLLSAICKSQMIAFVLSAAVHLMPGMLPISETNALYRVIVLMPFYHSQFSSIMSVEQMQNGTLYAIWAGPTALSFLGIGAVISRRIFAKHQVS